MLTAYVLSIMHSDVNYYYNYYIVVFSLIALPNQNKVDHWRGKRASAIQYGYRKCETLRVFSRTLAHGNSKIEIRQRNRGRRQAEKSEHFKYTKHAKKTRRPNCSSGLPSPWGRYSPKQWMNHLTNSTLHI